MLLYKLLEASHNINIITRRENTGGRCVSVRGRRAVRTAASQIRGFEWRQRGVLLPRAAFNVQNPSPTRELLLIFQHWKTTNQEFHQQLLSIYCREASVLWHHHNTEADVEGSFYQHRLSLTDICLVTDNIYNFNCFQTL